MLVKTKVFGTPAPSVGIRSTNKQFGKQDFEADLEGNDDK